MMTTTATSDGFGGRLNGLMGIADVLCFCSWCPPDAASVVHILSHAILSNQADLLHHTDWIDRPA